MLKAYEYRIYPTYEQEVLFIEKISKVIFFEAVNQ